MSSKPDKPERVDFWADVKPEDLSQDLRIVHDRCGGMDFVRKLVDELGGLKIYITQDVLGQAKERYVHANFDGSNHKELAVACRWSEEQVYKVLKTDRVKKDNLDLFR